MCISHERGAIFFKLKPEEYPWAQSHTWNSWRDRYVKNSAQWDVQIRKYQDKHNIIPPSTTRPDYTLHFKHRAAGGPPSTQSSRTEFSPGDDSHLAKYIARVNPGEAGRQGNKIYQNLVENVRPYFFHLASLQQLILTQTDKWPWAERHSWQSWRERYRNHKLWFDEQIEVYQRQKNINPTTMATRTPTRATVIDEDEDEDEVQVIEGSHDIRKKGNSKLTSRGSQNAGLQRRETPNLRQQKRPTLQNEEVEPLAESSAQAIQRAKTQQKKISPVGEEDDEPSHNAQISRPPPSDDYRQEIFDAEVDQSHEEMQEVVDMVTDPAVQEQVEEYDEDEEEVDQLDESYVLLHRSGGRHRILNVNLDVMGMMQAVSRASPYYARRH